MGGFEAPHLASIEDTPTKSRAQDLAAKYGLFGRDDTIRILLDAMGRSHRGHGELLLMAGVSGTGKTALVNVLKEPVLAKNGFFIEGKFNQFDQNVPYGALRQALDNFIEKLTQERPAELARVVRELAAASQSHGHLLLELIPKLATLIGTHPVALDTSAQDAKLRFADAFRTFMKVFSRPAHPTVLFIDDWQWADSASLELLTQMQVGTTLRFLLVIVVYRSNEVDEGHALADAIRLLQSQSAPIRKIEITNLEEAEHSALICNRLGKLDSTQTAFHKLVFGRTGGNPFFTSAYVDFIMERVPESDSNGDASSSLSQILSGVQEQDLPTNSVELFVERLRRLDADRQRLLALAACQGHQFELDALAMISGECREHCLELLDAAQMQSFVKPVDGPSVPSDPSANAVQQWFRFRHDCIQQAAIALIARENVPSTRLQIARNLLAKSSPEFISDYLFMVVENLNAGQNQIQEMEEQVRAVELNVRAASKAKAGAAFRSSLQFHRSARVIADRPEVACVLWRDHPALFLRLLNEQAETEFLAGELEAAQRCIRLAVSGARTPEQKAESLRILIVQQTLSGRYADAITTGREALGILEVKIPNDAELAASHTEVAEVLLELGDHSAMKLEGLSVAIAPTIRSALSLLIALGPPCYRSQPQLWAVIVPRVVSLMLKHGVTAQAGYSFPALAGLLMWGANDPRVVRDLGESAARVMQAAHVSQADRSVFHLMMGSSARHWFEHLSKSSEDYEAAYRVGLESGNLQYAAYAFGHNMYCRFFQGARLANLIEQTSSSIDFSRTRHNRWAMDLLEGGRTLFQLLMETGESHSGGLQIEKCEHSAQVDCIHNVLAATVHAILGNYEKAMDFSNKAHAAIETVGTQGLLPWAVHVFIRCLILAATSEPQEGVPTSQALAEINRLREHLSWWSSLCPINFDPMRLLIEAEVFRLQGNSLAAATSYGYAIDAARNGCFVHWEGVAHERAARFWRAWGNGKLEQLHWQQAYLRFEHWGAKAKLESMSADYVYDLERELSETLGKNRVSEASTATDCHDFANRLISQIRSQSTEFTSHQNQFESMGKATDWAKATDQLRSDIAAHKQANSELQKIHHALIRRVVESMPIAVVLLDSKGHIVLVNAQTETLFGHLRGDLLHQSLEVIFPEDFQKCIADPLSRISTEVNANQSIVVRGRRHDGGSLIIHLELSAIVSDSALHVMAAMLDITHQKRRERIQSIRQRVIELTSREHSLSKAMELLAVEAEACEPNIRCSVLTMNHETGQLLLCAAPSLPDEYNRAVHGIVVDPNAGSCGAAAYHGVPFMVNDVESHPNWKAFRHWSAIVGFRACWSVPVLSPTGKVLGTFALYHRDKRNPSEDELELMLSLADVAALAMEHGNFVQMLKQSNAELEQFAYVASHDLREPLRMVHSFCGLLKERYTGRLDDKADRYLDLAMDGASRMKILIERLLDYSRIGQKNTNAASTTMRSSVDNAIRNLQTKIQESGTFIEVGELPNVMGDATKLSQLFQNLLDNSIKFHRELPPRISITARPLGMNWEVTVQDNGLGIEPQYYDRVFEIFQRLHTREEYEGVGMGMAICKKIVEGLGGRIWLDSKLGEGTAVRFTIRDSSLHAPTQTLT